MNKAVALGLAFVIAAVFIGVAYAASQYGQQNGQNSQRGEYFTQMHSIMENGTYADLVALREETGRDLMPMVTDEASFAAMQERHEQMEAEYGEGPHRGGMGKMHERMHAGQYGMAGQRGKAGQRGHCMADSDD